MAGTPGGPALSSLQVCDAQIATGTTVTWQLSVVSMGPGITPALVNPATVPNTITAPDSVAIWNGAFVYADSIAVDGAGVVTATFSGGVVATNMLFVADGLNGLVDSTGLMPRGHKVDL